MRNPLRHPFLLAFVIGLVGLTWLTVDKANEQSAPAAAEGRRQGGAAALVAVGRVMQQQMADQVESLGTAGANESIDITAKVADTINKIHFEDGAFVRKGDLLVELTNASEASRLAEAQASANEAKRQYERLEELQAKKMVSNTDVDTVHTNMETANARLEGVMVAMSDRVVRAPFDGVLGFRRVSAGGLISPGTVITTLDDISTIKLDFTIPEVYLAEIKPGQRIEARSVVYRDREFSGEVKVVDSRVDPVTRSVTVRAHIDNPDAFLRPGMLLTVTLDLNEQQALVVPEEAVTVSGDHQYVFAIDGDNVAHQVEVTLGRRRPGIVEILSGLSSDQVIVTEGVAQVRSGQKVNILQRQEVGSSS